MDGIIEEVTSVPFLLSIIIIVAAGLILGGIKRFLIKRVAYTRKDENSKKNTLLGVLFNVLQYAVIIISLFLILSVHGVNVTTMLAGLGIVATIIGLSLQDTIKDVFAGIHIYMDNFYKVGDIVEYNGVNCVVKYFTASITKLTVLGRQDTITLFNRNCTAIRKVKDFQVVMINFPFEIDSKKIHDVFKKVCKRMDAEYGISKSQLFGPVDFSEKGMTYALAFTASFAHLEYRNKAIAIAHDELRKAKIRPTFNIYYQ